LGWVGGGGVSAFFYGPTFNIYMPHHTSHSKVKISSLAKTAVYTLIVFLCVYLIICLFIYSFIYCYDAKFSKRLLKTARIVKRIF